MNSTTMNLVCDKGCKRTFSAHRMIRRELCDGVDGYYIKCPYCGHKYRVFYSNAEDRKIRKQLHNKSITIEERSQLLERLQQISEELNKKYDPKV